MRTFTVFPGANATLEALVHVVAPCEMVHVFELADPFTITVNAYALRAAPVVGVSRDRHRQRPQRPDAADRRVAVRGSRVRVRASRDQRRVLGARGKQGVDPRVPSDRLRARRSRTCSAGRTRPRRSDQVAPAEPVGPAGPVAPLLPFAPAAPVGPAAPSTRPHRYRPSHQQRLSDRFRQWRRSFPDRPRRRHRRGPVEPSYRSHRRAVSHRSRLSDPAARSARSDPSTSRTLSAGRPVRSVIAVRTSSATGAPVAPFVPVAPVAPVAPSPRSHRYHRSGP